MADPTLAAVRKQKPELKIDKLIELDSRSRDLYGELAGILKEAVAPPKVPATTQPAPQPPAGQVVSPESSTPQSEVAVQKSGPSDSTVALDALKLVGDSQLALGAYLATGDKRPLETYRADRKAAWSLISKAKQESATNPALLPLFVRAESLLSQWEKQVDEPRIKWREEKTRETGITGVEIPNPGGKQTAHFRQFSDALDQYIIHQQTRLEGLRRKASDNFSRTERAIILLALLVIVAAVAKNYVLTGRTTKPLVEAVGLAEAISQGDLRGKIEATRSDEAGRLGKALNSMVQGLRAQASRILEGVTVLSSSSESISTTVSQLSASTSKTAAAVTQATTTVEELKQAAQVSSEKARDVAKTSQEAVQISESGLKATEETARRIHVIKGQMETISQTVVALNERAEAIQGIIATVQDLADQSNLLAVNASIEAARAGEHGKGFAVVAHEIKSLADQSKQATNQVRELLGQVQHSVEAVVTAADLGAKAVDSGVEESSSAGESIRALAACVADSSQSASVIESTSKQQFMGIDQVSVAIRNVEQVMEETLAGTSRLEVAVQQLQTLGEAFSDLAKRYKL